MARQQSFRGWFWLVGIPMLGIAVAVYHSYAPRFLQRIIENFLYWVNYALPSSIREVLGL